MSTEEQLAAIERLEPFLVTIRDHLWSSPSGGRAAAFVGAGLSLNAEAVATGGPRMVVWREVAARMLQRLDPKRAQPGFGDEALHIAQEYEAAFGRRELDRLLKECIPDSNHEPSLLHRYLLQLPWADVFTTNQDTLLERTLPFVTNRKYDPVTSIEDISATRSPRIVKLHGSLPSRRPFIFTEEDFRTYPTRFSPFVNMVQQSMMENVFCLFGFSGDDPNFLNWSGWVRDALGEHAPVIYLIGVLELSDSKRSLLQSRNVVPLDLAQVFPTVPHADPGVRHKAALEWVLLSLVAGRPIVNTTWPTSAPISVPEPLYSRDVQPLKSRKPESTTSVTRLPDDTFDPFLLYNAWKVNRENYPGWVILPGDNRKSLWNQTQVFYLSYPSSKSVWQHIPELEPHQTVLLLHETVWILERCLFPLKTDQADLIRSSLEKINPFPNILELTSALVTPTQTQDLFWKDTKFDWREVASAWVHLAFALMRLAREDLDIEAFTMWRDRLEPLGGLQLEWAARWSHEMTQYHLASLAEKQVREHLTRWPDTSNSPGWSLKKAAAFAELGEFQKAQNLATQAVARVRRSLQEDQESVYFLSLESWALSSLQVYTQAIKFLQNGSEANGKHLELERESYRERLEALKPYRCDPQSERNRLELRVSGKRPVIQLEGERVEEQPGFDPGSRERTQHIGWSTNYFEETLPAFGLLKLSDEVGYPLHCPNFTTFSELDHAAEWIWSLSPLWAISAFVRSGKGKELNRWFTRARVVTLSATHVNVLAKLLLDGGRQALMSLEQADIPGLSYAHNILPSVLELLSRLCFRLNASQLDELSNFTLDAYKALAIRKDYMYFEPLGNLLERAIATLTDDKAFSLLSRYMELPLSYEEAEMPLLTRWPEPKVFLDASRMLNFNSTNDAFINTQKLVPMLLERARHGGFQARWRAVGRLVWLYKRDVLSAEQQHRFTDALWSRLNSDGLPEETNMGPSSVLYLPEPEPRKAENALRKFLVSKDISPVVTLSEKGGFSTSGGLAGNRILQTWLETNRIPQEDEIGIGWTADDVETLVDKLCQWSGEEPEPSHYLKSSGIFSSGINDRLYLVDLCFDEIIYPRAEQLSDDGKENLEKLCRRLGKLGHRAIVSLPSSLCLDRSENHLREVKHQLRSHLSSYNPEDVSYTLRAVRRWAYLAGLGLIPDLPDDLLRELGNKILMRRDPELISTIGVITGLISSSPSLLSNNLVEDLLQALEYLLSEVELPDILSIDAVANQRQVFAVEERPDAFAFTARLAAKLHQRFLDENKDVPEILEEWQRRATSSVLPEVKSAFYVDAQR